MQDLATVAPAFIEMAHRIVWCTAATVDGPIREYYLVGPSDTRDESLWQTEIGWPIFQTRPRL